MGTAAKHDAATMRCQPIR